MAQISSVIDKSNNSYVFNMSGVRPFEYTPSRFIKVFASGELLNKETSFLDFNEPVRVIFVHKGFQNQVQYIPFTLNASGTNGTSKIVTIYEPTGNNLGNVTWGSIGSDGNFNGPSFSVNNYGPFTGVGNFIVDRWFYSGSNYLGATGSTFIKGSDRKTLINSPTINNNAIKLNQSGSTVGVSGILLNNYTYDLGELLVINKNMTCDEIQIISDYLLEKYDIPPSDSDDNDWGGGGNCDSSSSTSNEGDEGGGGGGGGGGIGDGSVGGGNGSGDPIWKLFTRNIPTNSVQRDSEGRITSVTVQTTQTQYIDTSTRYSTVLSYTNLQAQPFVFDCSAGRSCNNRLPGVLLNINVGGYSANQSDLQYQDDILTCNICYTPSINGHQMLWKFSNLQSVYPNSVSRGLSDISNEDSLPKGLVVDFFNYVQSKIDETQEIGVQEENNNFKKISSNHYKIKFNPKINENFKSQNEKNVGALNTSPYLLNYVSNMLSLLNITPGAVNPDVPILDTNNSNAKWELAPNFTCIGCNTPDPVSWNTRYACGPNTTWACNPCDPACPSSQIQDCNNGGVDIEMVKCCNTDSDFNLPPDLEIPKYLCKCYDGFVCGCTNPYSPDYDPNAEYDDGSCRTCFNQGLCVTDDDSPCKGDNCNSLGDGCCDAGCLPCTTPEGVETGNDCAPTFQGSWTSVNGVYYPSCYG